MSIPQSTIDKAKEANLLELAGKDTYLKRVSATDGGEYAGACPFCGGSDRFRVWPEQGRWHCLGQTASRKGCDRAGDAIDYVRERDHLDFQGAVEHLTGPIPEESDAKPAQTAGESLRTPLSGSDSAQRVQPPPEAWQNSARAFVSVSQDRLWSDAGAKAREWLRDRGFGDDVIRGAGLGFNDRDRYEDRQSWGLDPELNDNGNPKKVWLPRGIVIPWEIEGEMWRVNIRRPLTPQQIEAGEQKYIGPAGFAMGLYNAEKITADKPAVLVEGELDALTVQQHAGDIVVPVATGATSHARRLKWITRLALPPLVLVSFDSDDAGEAAAAYWIDALPNAKRWRPYWGDANDLARAGADVRAWIAAGLPGERRHEPVAGQQSAENTLDNAVWPELDAGEASDDDPEVLAALLTLYGNMMSRIDNLYQHPETREQAIDLESEAVDCYAQGDIDGMRSVQERIRELRSKAENAEAAPAQKFEL